jgi:hypothetical protein
MSRTKSQEVQSSLVCRQTFNEWQLTTFTSQSDLAVVKPPERDYVQTQMKRLEQFED